MPLPIDLDVEHWVRVTPAPGRSQVVKVLGNACFHSSEAEPPELKAPGEPVSGPTELTENSTVTVEGPKWFLQKATSEERSGKTAIKPAILETQAIQNEAAGTEEIANGSVTSAKIKNEAVTNEKIAQEKLTASVAKAPTAPVANVASEGTIVLGTSVLARSILIAWSGKHEATPVVKLKHGLNTEYVSVTAWKSSAKKAVETIAITKVAFKSAEECEATLTAEPAAKEEIFFLVSG